jgi:ABC-2 type transport system ATP-binding protein
MSTRYTKYSTLPRGNQPVIEIAGLTKYYKTVRGIENVNLAIMRGEVFGFLGPNGAGKSTTIRLLLNLIQPTRGRITVFGQDIRKHYYTLFQNIGNVPGEFRLYEEVTGQYFLDYMQSFRKGQAVLQDELLQAFQLSRSDLEKKIKHYFHGMKQKLAIVQALQHQPALLVMDEPSEGLDPLNKNVLYRYIGRFKAEGKTVFFSSHYLAEVEKICDRVGLVRNGSLIAVEKISELKKKMIRKLEISFSEPVEPGMFRMPGIRIAEQNGNRFLLLVGGDLNALIQKISRYKIENLVFPEPSLEETFLTFYK